MVFLRPSKEANFSREEEEEWAGIHKHTKRRMKVKQNQNLIRKEKKQRKRGYDKHLLQEKGKTSEGRETQQRLSVFDIM